MRIQILELPLRTAADGESYAPFILVFSEVPSERMQDLPANWTDVEIEGCEHILTTDLFVDIGEGGQTVYEEGQPSLRPENRVKIADGGLVLSSDFYGPPVKAYVPPDDGGF